MITNDSIKPIPRMRTIAEAARELKELDEHTAMTPYHIRRLCLEGILPTVNAGNKRLLDLNILLDYMSNPTAEKYQPRPAETFHGIRKIS